MLTHPLVITTTSTKSQLPSNSYNPPSSSFILHLKLEKPWSKVLSLLLFSFSCFSSFVLQNHLLVSWQPNKVITHFASFNFFFFFFLLLCWNSVYLETKCWINDLFAGEEDQTLNEIIISETSGLVELEDSESADVWFYCFLFFSVSCWEFANLNSILTYIYNIR